MRVGFRIDKVKGMFFDRTAVTKAVDRAKRRVLSRFGAFVRRRARSSIRKRKAVSQPGQPPSSHTGLLRRLIFFFFDRDRESVVIGPLKANTENGGGLPTVPEVLEEGGTAMRKRAGKRVRARYRARPFMGPAFEQEKPQLPQMWSDSVK